MFPDRQRNEIHEVAQTGFDQLKHSFDEQDKSSDIEQQPPFGDGK